MLDNFNNDCKNYIFGEPSEKADIRVVFGIRIARARSRLILAAATGDDHGDHQSDGQEQELVELHGKIRLVSAGLT